MIKPRYAHWANFYHGAVSIFSGSHCRRTWSKEHSTAAICRCCAAHWLPPRLTTIDFSKLWFWHLELGNFPTMGKRKKEELVPRCSHGLPLLPSVSAFSAKSALRSWKAPTNTHLPWARLSGVPPQHILFQWHQNAQGFSLEKELCTLNLSFLVPHGK